MSRLLVRTHNHNIKHDTFIICLVFKNMRWICVHSLKYKYIMHIYTPIFISSHSIYTKKQKQKVPTMIRMGVIFPSWYTPNYLRGSDPCSVSSLSTRHFGKVRDNIQYHHIYSALDVSCMFMYCMGCDCLFSLGCNIFSSHNIFLIFVNFFVL